MKLKNLLLITMLICSVLTIDAKAEEGKYPAGSLLALNEKGATVYYIGEDGKKYIFPDDKTYFTWYDNFDDVIKVGISELDKYLDGGIMPYRPNSKLITHQNTANVYAVEPNGVLRKITSEEVARNLYGDNWGLMVQDVIPGYFSAAYTVGSELVDKLPTGALVKEEGKDDIYYVYNRYKRKFVNDDAFLANGFKLNNVLEVVNLSNYDLARDIKEQEDILLNFNKDKLYKYSSLDLYYSIKYAGGSYNNQSTATVANIQFTVYANGSVIENRPIEIRKAIVRGMVPMNIGYRNKKYYFDFFAVSSNNYREYNNEPIKIDDLEVGLQVSSNSEMRIDLKEWVIWDLEEDKQIINIHSQILNY